jgi:hypothetical protein
VREISRDPNSHEFLLKALREAGGELFNELESIRARDAHRSPEGEWSFAQIAVHVRDSEEITLAYVRRIVTRRSASLEYVDSSVTAIDSADGTLDLSRCAYEYAYLRQQLLHELWELNMQEWQRCGTHPYRGELSVLQLARELHLHDLEHLWQVRSHRQVLAVGAFP